MGLNSVTALRKNRKVNRNPSLEELGIQNEGLKMHLRGDGFVAALEFVGKNGRMDYVITNAEVSR